MQTLLIADDSMFQRFQVSKAAREVGFLVKEARNGQECLDMVASDPPDVLLLDLNMPTIDGLGVLKSIREQGVQSKVLILTADIQDTTRQRCLELGVVEFLNKPLEEDVLKARLQALLD